jgi:hypothetical protein
METIETVTLKHGLVARIEYDFDCPSPFEDDDGLLIVILHRHYADPSNGECGTTPDEVAEWRKANAREWYTVPLYLYEHGRCAYRVGQANPFSCPWDSGQVGIIALRKSEWGRGRGERNAKRFEYAQSVADEYTSWANGDCYGYIIEDADGEELDSCWGYVGMDSVEQAIAEAAPACEDEAAEKEAAAIEETRPDLHA